MMNQAHGLQPVGLKTSFAICHSSFSTDMSAFRLIIAAFLHHWRMNLAVAAGAAVGTAVLAGALLVGDSMRGSLRYLALDRLGNIDEALIADRFFHAQLADELFQQDDAGKIISTAVPAIILSANMENPAPNRPLRANRVQLIGCDQPFWQLGPSLSPAPLLKSREIVLNRPLAEKLAVRPGDEVIVRLPRPGAIPADSRLRSKTRYGAKFPPHCKRHYSRRWSGTLRPKSHTAPAAKCLHIARVAARSLGTTRPGKRHFCAIAKRRAKILIRRRFKSAKSAPPEIDRSGAWH